MRGIFTGWGIRILIVGAIAVGGVLFRDRLSANAGELRVGDCFDDPAGSVQVIEDVSHHPCTEAHDNEVFVVATHPAAKDAPFPSDPEIETFIDQTCVPQFESYTGRSAASESALDLGWYSPTSTGWATGDRVVICFLYNVDGAKLTMPLKKAG